MTDVSSQGELDRRLRSTFRTKADQLVVRHTNFTIDAPTTALAGNETKRSPQRRRRPALIWAGALFVAIGLAIAFAMSPWTSGGSRAVRAPANSQAFPPPCDLSTPGASQVLPCDPGDGNLQLTERVVVAEGDTDANHWQLEVYESTAGLCVDLRIGRGTKGGCGGRADPAGVGVSRDASGGSWIKGPVRKDVTQIRLELSDGQVLEVSPVGTSAGFPVNFYVAAVPVGTEVAQVVSLDAGGNEVGRQSAPRLSELGFPSEATGSLVELPNVVGLSLEDAEAAVIPLGCSLRVSFQDVAPEQEGRVLLQSPAAGDFVDCTARTFVGFTVGS